MLAFVVSLVLAACASSSPKGADTQMLTDATDPGGRLEPSTDGERTALAQLDALPPDQPRKTGTGTLVAGPEYDAASGRRCRTIVLTDSKARASRTRLACRDGNGWFYVPDVLPRAAAE